MRIVVEAALVLALVLLVRAPVLLMGEWLHDTFRVTGTYPGDAVFVPRFVGHSLLGAVVMLPMVVAWVTPDRTPQRQFGRAFTVLGLLIVAQHLGLLATVPLGVATCCALAAAQLLLVGHEWTPAFSLARAGEPSGRVRRARPPHHQLARDFVLRPLPLLGLFLAIQALLLILDQTILPRLTPLGGDSPGFYYLLSMVNMGLAFGFIALWPMGSGQVMAGAVGKHGFRSGDFAAAWAVLPVRPEAVMRAVFLHGLIGWALVLGAVAACVCLSNWLGGASFALVDRDGDTLVWLLLPMLAAAPCVAAFLTASAAGGRRWSMVSFLAVLGVVHGNPILLVLKTPAQVHVAVLAAIMLLGTVPALNHLRRGRAATPAAAHP